MLPIPARFADRADDYVRCLQKLVDSDLPQEFMVGILKDHDFGSNREGVIYWLIAREVERNPKARELYQRINILNLPAVWQGMFIDAFLDAQFHPEDAQIQQTYQDTWSQYIDNLCDFYEGGGKSAAETSVSVFEQEIIESAERFSHIKILYDPVHFGDVTLRIKKDACGVAGIPNSDFTSIYVLRYVTERCSNLVGVAPIISRNKTNITTREELFAHLQTSLGRNMPGSNAATVTLRRIDNLIERRMNEEFPELGLQKDGV